MILIVLCSLAIFASAQAAQEDDKIYTLSQVDRKPKVTRKPGARTYGKCRDQSGTALLSVVLSKSGEVGDVRIVKPSPCVVFNESALKAAKEIEFEPALKNGKPVSVAISVEYKFLIY